MSSIFETAALQMTMDENDAPNVGGGLSKSQKKRMKRNAAKKRAAKKAEEDAAAVNSTLPSETSMNPHNILLLKLVKAGYEMTDINRAIQDMWDEGLEYGEFSAVASFLEKRQTEKELRNKMEEAAAPEPEVEAEEEPEPEVVSPMHAEGDSNSTTEEADVDTVEISKEVEVAEPSVTASATDTNVTAEVEKEEESPEQPESNSSQKPKGKGRKSKRSSGGSSTRSNSLISKLDVVANNDNLMDAIIALTEWVNKAATQTELKDFCTGSASKALHIVISRALNKSEPGSITGQVLDFVGSILRTVGVPTSSMASSVKSLGSAMRQARITASLDGNLSEHVISSFTNNVLSTLSKTVDVATTSAQDGASTIRSLESEIESMSAANGTAGSNGAQQNDVSFLMSNREHNKIAAEKYSKILNLTTRGSCMNANGAHANGSAGEKIHSSVDSASFYGDQYEAFTSSKSQQEALQKRLEAATSSTYKERETIMSSLSACTSEREKIASRKDELKLELRQLEMQDVLLKDKIEQEKMKMANFEQSLTGEAHSIEANLKVVSKRVSVHESVEKLISDIEDFSLALGKSSSATADSSDKSIGHDALPKLTKNLEGFLQKSENYFVAELKLIEFLAERAVALEQKLPSLEHEIEECTALGMGRNVTNMKKTLADNLQKIAEDKGAVNFLREEAGKMRYEVSDCVEQYLSFKDGANFAEIPNASSFKKIQTCASQIGLPSDSRFNNLVKNFNTLSSAGDTNGFSNNLDVGSEALIGGFDDTEDIPGHVIVEDKDTVAASAPTPVPATATASLSAAAAVKKQGWGQVKSTAAPTKSLLEIQKEELSMK